MSALRVTIAGQTMSLFPQRAAFWHASSTLLVADLHLGRQQAWRAGGVPISDRAQLASLDEPLQRLSTVLHATAAARVLVLGDLLHAPAGLTDAMVDHVAAWRAGHRGVRFDVVPGNHDRHLDRVIDAWRLVVAERRVVEAPFEFVHNPADAQGMPPAYTRGGEEWLAGDPASTVASRRPGNVEAAVRPDRSRLSDAARGVEPHPIVTCSGHIHPMVRLATSRESLRVPAFLASGRLFLLPAFCGFFSGVTVEPAPDSRIYPIAGDRVLDLSGR